MTFTPSGPIPLLFFLLILVFNLGGLIWALFFSVRKPMPIVLSLLVGIGIFCWAVQSGWIAKAPMPRLPILFLVSIGWAILLAFSPAGKQMASKLSLQVLVGFQAFRLPLELVLHAWAAGGTIPGTMTWTGNNFDIISGILALVCFPWVGKLRFLARIFNVIGFALLLNVMRVAMLSSPLPFSWPLMNPLQLALYLPYALIVPLCVGQALLGHLLLSRKLVEKR